MKKGFTMIELIFVIVILGILAAVAIPRLAATRDDAEIVKTVQALQTVVQDYSSYYTSQGEFKSNLKDMTNVVLGGTNTAPTLDVAGKPCINLSFDANSSLVLGAASSPTPLCTSVLGNKAVSKMMSSSPINLKGIGVKF